MLNNNQTQDVESGSMAVQAGGSVTINNTGLTYSEMRQVALDVFKANFYELAGMAKDTVDARAEEITEAVLKKLHAENPSGFSKFVDPDFQYALFTVQKEYARCGDKELGDLLVDLLVDRSKHGQRDFLQIVLNECLNTAPKLTDVQLAALAVIFTFKFTQNYGLLNHELLGQYLDQYLLPFVGKLTKNPACYQHLEFSGCGSVGLAGNTLEGILSNIYQGQFLKGFDEAEIANRNLSVGLDPRFFIVCLNDPTKVQVNSNSKESLISHLDRHSVSSEDKSKIIDLFDLGKMNEHEVRETLIALRPYMSDVLDTWTNSSMQTLTLTSVGIGIGHANIKRLVGEFADLSLWIN
jgi:hypothetical protein